MPLGSEGRSCGTRYCRAGQLRGDSPAWVPGRVATPDAKKRVRWETLCASHSAACLSLQDLAWMTTFYVRLFLTYVPLLGVKGFLVLFFMVR